MSCEHRNIQTYMASAEASLSHSPHSSFNTYITYQCIDCKLTISNEQMLILLNNKLNKLLDLKNDN